MPNNDAPKPAADVLRERAHVRQRIVDAAILWQAALKHEDDAAFQVAFDELWEAVEQYQEPVQRKKP